MRGRIRFTFTYIYISSCHANTTYLLEQPEPISEFRLDAYLSQLRSDGYTVFIARGALPKPNFSEGPNWMKISSLASGGSQSQNDKDEPKFKAFSGAGNRLDGKSRINEPSMSVVGLSEDEMIAAAIAMSLQGGEAAAAVSETRVLTDAERKEATRRERLVALEKRGVR
jgi:Ubiquitin interaction motif